ncbi:hypothetical protein AWB71_05046 [Caballeronia peredens]|uniref:DUF4148 domain-containing protein n=1 Tax=Caballeronia novacaledonica TaxID=1544861 RepID=A0AA37IB21_9BURK|nr:MULTISPECIES: DUF4148 domain-containing protein [Caballeronia]MDR5743563.1 DUF4148 domain-containing protein [Caballeronia sp. LZ029]GJH25837.1 DUF4148 domain-containing protein [Caballeronia novacaledonica]SAL75558.1 hypothetical protein AWB71_05046 [Caballeronia peredens]
MKAAKLAVMFAATAVSMGVISQAAMAQGKTREQVRQELIQAQHDGITPVAKTQYPPTEANVARNKEIHAAYAHGGEKSPNVDHHDQLAGR